MKKTAIVALLVVALGGVPSPAQGQGWSLGSELGAHVVPALGITGLSNDRARMVRENGRGECIPETTWVTAVSEPCRLRPCPTLCTSSCWPWLAG